jgi:hypothetical protein
VAWYANERIPHVHKEHRTQKPMRANKCHPVPTTPVAARTKLPTDWMQAPKRCAVRLKTHPSGALPDDPEKVPVFDRSDLATKI